MRVAINAFVFFLIFFLIEKRSRAKGSSFSTKDEWCVWEREGKGTKKKEESDKNEKKENKIQRKHSAYHSGLETLVQKSYTGPRGTKYNVSVDSYLHESAIRIITIQLLRNSCLLTRVRLTQET